MIDRIALLVVILGCLYLGVAGIFNIELVSCDLNDPICLLKRFIFAMTGVCGLWCSAFFFKFKHKKKIELP